MLEGGVTPLFPFPVYEIPGLFDRRHPLTGTNTQQAMARFFSNVAQQARCKAALPCTQAATILVSFWTGLYAATKSLLTVYDTLSADGTSQGVLDNMVQYKEFNDLVSILTAKMQVGAW